MPVTIYCIVQEGVLRHYIFVAPNDDEDKKEDLGPFLFDELEDKLKEVAKLYNTKKVVLFGIKDKVALLKSALEAEGYPTFII